MPKRFIKESICTSDTLDGISAEAERLFYRLIVKCDDHGRFDGRSAVIASSCFPLKRSLEDSAVEAWLDELSEAGLLSLYTVAGRRYLQMTTWGKHQSVRAKESKYPPMEEPEHACAQVRADESNGAQMFPYSYPYSYSKSESYTTCAREDASNNNDSAVDEFGVSEITQADREFQQAVLACVRAGIEVKGAYNERDIDRCIGEHGLPQTLAAIEIASQKPLKQRNIGMLKGILKKFHEQGGTDDEIAARASPGLTGSGPPGYILPPMSPEEIARIEGRVPDG